MNFFTLSVAVVAVAVVVELDVEDDAAADGGVGLSTSIFAPSIFYGDLTKRRLSRDHSDRYRVG